jgi:trimeric autotransporter adhesin
MQSIKWKQLKELLRMRLKAIFMLILIVCLMMLNIKIVSAVQSVSGFADINPLKEYDLEGAKIYITLTNQQLKTSITASDIELVNAPVGLAVKSLQRIDAYHAVVTLTYPFTDFDVDYPSFFVRVKGTGTVSGEILETNSIPIYHEIEPSDEIMASPQPRPLTEGNLNGAVIRLYVSDSDMFHNDASQKLNGFQLVNAPPGLRVASFSGNGTQYGYLTLAYDGTDFDTDFPNFRIKLEGENNDGDNIPGVWRNSTDELSDPIPIKAINEANLSSTMNSNPSPLSETNLNGAQLNININGDIFQYNIFNSSYFSLNNAPVGTTISNIMRIDDRNARLTLSFSGDFDQDITNFNVGILKNALTGNTPLTTNNLSIKAIDETPATITATTIPNQLYENNLDGSRVNLTLNQDRYSRTLNINDVQLLNGPPGLTISNVVRLSNTVAEVHLAYNGTDFDTDFTNISFNVLSSGLETAPSAASNTITIKAMREIEGQGNYIANGNAYPTQIEMTGHNAKNQELHINTTLHTDMVVDRKTATFHYFVKVYNSSGTVIGNHGDIDSTATAITNPASQNVEITNLTIPLTQNLPIAYRIVVIIVSVSIN